MSNPTADETNQHTDIDISSIQRNFLQSQGEEETSRFPAVEKDRGSLISGFQTVTESYNQPSQA
jgi:hypothetical protein